MSDRSGSFPPVNPVTRPSQIQKNLFPFSSFSADDPNVTASPGLTLASPWVRKGTFSGTFSGTGTGLTNAIADTAANLASSNPTLLKGQIGYETDTKFFKIGDGTTAYNSLSYQPQFGTLPTYTKDAAYTPTFTGFGTPTGVNFFYSRVGNRIKVMGKFTAGTTTAVEARIYLPVVNSVQLLSDSVLIPSIMGCGTFVYNQLGPAIGYCLIEPGVGYITMSVQSSSAGDGGLTKMFGSRFTSNPTFSVWFELPVSGWQ